MDKNVTPDWAEALNSISDAMGGQQCVHVIAYYAHLIQGFKQWIISLTPTRTIKR